jgi:hypothetical protein
MYVSPVQPHMEAVRVVPGHAVNAQITASFCVSVFMPVPVPVDEKGEQ